MNFVWNGSYPLYFEDAREAFGNKYGLEYMTIFNNGCYAPLVDSHFQYKKPILYGMHPRIDITYRPSAAAKIMFDYEIHDTVNEELLTVGTTVQVFLDSNYKLILENPEFYQNWKQKWGVVSDEL